MESLSGASRNKRRKAFIQAMFSASHDPLSAFTSTVPFRDPETRADELGCVGHTVTSPRTAHGGSARRTGTAAAPAARGAEFREAAAARTRRRGADIAAICELPNFEHVDREIVDGVLDELGRFVAEVVAPVNRIGDEEGCSVTDGVVTVPDAFGKASDMYVESGWGPSHRTRTTAVEASRAPFRQ